MVLVEKIVMKIFYDMEVFSTSASVIKKNFLINNRILFSEKKVFSSFEDYDFFLNIAFLKRVVSIF